MGYQPPQWLCTEAEGQVFVSSPALRISFPGESVSVGLFLPSVGF